MDKLRNILKFKNKYIEGLFLFFTITLLSFITMTITFVFSSATWDIPMFKSYFSSGLLVFMNLIPIFIVMIILYVVTNRMWLSYLLTSIIFISMSIVNRFKLTYRDEPFAFLDIKLIKESMEMTETYSIKFTPNMIIMVVGVIIITVVLKFLLDNKLESKKLRVSLFLGVVIISFIIFNKPYFNSTVYAELGDKTLINVWSKSQQFQSKGFVYPFIYSITEARETVLEGYDEEKAIEDLYIYEYEDIPTDQKVNVIAIMLEAYNDFSKFESIDLQKDPYQYFHTLQEESIHGKLVTNVFGGGTIDTERAFLTGYKNHPKYYKDTNSFVRYLNEQGYKTEAMHPIYGWFYNRRNANTYIGFDNYDYYENKYSKVSEEFLQDIDFFDYIIEGYETSIDNDEPYFNFSVTYQNHGPYDENSYPENQFIENKENYDEIAFNMFNNYLAGIGRTDIAIKKLVEYFREQDEPTVIVFFGDHNPWLGKDDIGYDMLDIDIDFASVDGLLNYYETPYLIWGNESAKDTIGKDLVGEASNISPNFLMAELFGQLGWKGNEYMQYVQEVKSYIDVNHEVYFKENGEYTLTLSEENEKRYKDFLNVEFYNSHNVHKVDQ